MAIDQFQQFLICLTAIFVAMDPIGNVPFFLSLTEKLTLRERVKTIRSSVYTAFVVALIFLFLGKGIFSFLGIGVSDFKIAGGLILLLVSLADLLNGPDHRRESSGNTGIVPLAVPLITGPGVITTVILQQQASGNVITLIALLINFGITWLVLSNSNRVGALIGKDGTVVISKIAALLLSAIAVAMIRSGIQETFFFKV